jgi:uncharacterized protein DUF397
MTITTWRKSSRSGGGNACVEVALRDAPAIRDSKGPAEGHLNIEPICWGPFLAALKAGKLDR